jgi:SAM-dependent methyltransferase
MHALLPERGVVLDIGCGRGQASEDRCVRRRQLADLRGAGRRIVGIDVDEAAAANPLIDEFRPIRDIRAWPVDTASVDVAIARSVLEHVPDPDAFFAELVRVLKPGGIFAAHTPNRFGYASVAAAVISNRLHAKVIGFVQPGRQERDVFPTLFRMNSARRLRRLAVRHGLECVVHGWEGEPGYLSFSPLVYRIGAAPHRLLPPPLQSVLFVWMRKPGETG